MKVDKLIKKLAKTNPDLNQKDLIKLALAESLLKVADALSDVSVIDEPPGKTGAAGKDCGSGPTLTGHEIAGKDA